MNKEEEEYTCIKCGSLVFWDYRYNCFYCSLASKTKWKDCSVSAWGSSNDDDPLIEIAKRQTK